LDNPQGGTTAAERWLSVIPGLAEHKLRVHFARGELLRLADEDLCHALNAICQLAEGSRSLARDVLAAFLPLLVDIEQLPRMERLREVSWTLGLPSASRLLRASSVEGHLLSKHAYAPAGSIASRDDGRELSLGERRALARQPSRKSIETLLRDPHPMVVSLLLENPRTTEDHVMQMVTRRPSQPQVTREVSKGRWVLRARVRLGIVLNPGAPPAVSVPVLALLVRPELQQVADAGDLPAVVRATARELHELRPPLLRGDEPPTLIH
jgi:hypothetical protein